MKPRASDENVPRGWRSYSEELKAERRHRHAAGETIPQLAERTGMAFGQVKFMCGGSSRKGEGGLQAP